MTRSRSMHSYLLNKGEGRSMTCEGRRGVTGFNVHHLSIIQFLDDGAYLISVVALPSSVSKDGSYTNLSYPEGEPTCAQGDV